MFCFVNNIYMKFKTVLYYSDEINDEVIKNKIQPIKIDKTYKYTNNNFFYKLWSWVTYRVFATPLAFLYFKVIKKVKFINKNKLKEFKNQSYFIYANHTNQFCDGFCPALITFPKKPYVVCSPANLSVPFFGKFVKMWGALPTPNTIEAVKNFNLAIENTLKDNNPIVIYPEAHLWPYYTKIRNFSSVSFRYPIKFNKPVFCFTTIYKMTKYGKKPKIEILIDGPFYYNNTLPSKQAQNALRDEIYKTMVENSKQSNYEYATYIKRNVEND